MFLAGAYFLLENHFRVAILMSDLPRYFQLLPSQCEHGNIKVRICAFVLIAVLFDVLNS